MIRVPEVRVIDAEGKQLGIFVTVKAVEMAQDQGLDLVEISPAAKPPVCKIMDYGKFKYQQTKKLKEAKKHQVVVTLKEVKFRPTTDDHDFNFKVRNIQRFIEEGHKVKVTMVFRGREMMYREKGREILLKIAEKVGETATREVDPKMEGRQMMMILTTQKK
jgi:translation initiation factor IF-3